MLPCPRGVPIPPPCPHVKRTLCDRGSRWLVPRRCGQCNPISYLFSVAPGHQKHGEPSGGQMRSNRLKIFAASGLALAALGAGSYGAVALSSGTSSPTHVARSAVADPTSGTPLTPSPSAVPSLLTPATPPAGSTTPVVLPPPAPPVSSTPPVVTPPPPVPAPSPVVQQQPPATSGIPQGGGGDGDPDNSGAPSDGDGDV